jgi:hypothetical protein
MTVFGELRETYRAKLAAAFGDGTNVTTDPGALVPYVLVDAVTVVGSAGVGGWTGRLPIRCVVPAPGDAVALAALETMLETVLVTLGGAPATPETSGPTDLPAYVVTYPVEIPNPNC